MLLKNILSLCIMKHSVYTILHTVKISLETGPYLFLEVTLYVWSKLLLPHSLFVITEHDQDWSLFADKHPYCIFLSWCYPHHGGGRLTNHYVLIPLRSSEHVCAGVWKIISIYRQYDLIAFLDQFYLLLLCLTKRLILFRQENESLNLCLVTISFLSCAQTFCCVKEHVTELDESICAL